MKLKVLVLLTVVLVSCRKFDIITDQYWSAAVLSTPGISLRGVGVVEIDAKDGQNTRIEYGGKSEYILLSPLYSLRAEKLSKEYPEKYLFCFGDTFKGNRDDDKVIMIFGMNSRKDMDELVKEIKKRIQKKDFSDIDLRNSGG